MSISNPTVKVTQREDEPVPHEVIAKSIVSISQGVRRLRSGPLNDRALILLIQHAAPPLTGGGNVTARDVRAVLLGIDNLEREYLRPVKKEKA